MMEPFSVLSLASSVLQIVQFTSQLSKHIHEVWTQGTPKSISHLRIVTHNAIRQAGDIKAKLVSAVPSAADLVALPTHDQRLLSLAIEYEAAGSELLKYLDRLFPHLNGKPSFLQSVDRVARASLKRETLEQFLERLVTLQDALKLEVVTASRADFKQHKLETNGQFGIINKDLQIIIQQLEQSPIQDEQRLRDIINSCLTQHFSWTHQYLQDNAMDTWKGKSILRMLYFRQIQDRHQEVATACSNTLEWIFRPPAGYHPWSNFVDFLEMDQSVPYWINGKAGSGKSTLAKFILGHQQTQRGLSKWAGKVELVVVSFFLWNQGTPLQKSLVGLLRSLLHTVLETHPDWIAGVFPALWEKWKVTDEEEPPSLVEVRQGVEKLLAKRAMKLCILVDGVDEFDGNHSELASYLKGLCGPDTKVILTSRPIPDSVAAFETCPQLRLQDLTVNDIKIFVKRHLIESPQLKMLLQAHPVEAKDLVSELQEKADGVFLWVHLVIKLLTEGLQKGEQIADLQRRLRAMPPTLELLYSRMMENMDYIHQVKAAETFQIVESWNAKRMEIPLSALLLSATEIQDNLAKGPLTLAEVKDRCKKVESFIRNRCCGLLEIHRHHVDSDHARTVHAGLVQGFDKIKAEDVATIDSSVQYLHRTVAEFLHTYAIWPNICSLTPESFDTESELTSACYFMVRHQPTTNRATGEIWKWINNYAIFARGISKTDDASYLKQMRLLEETMTEFHQASQGDSIVHWSSHWPLATTKKLGDPKLEETLLMGHNFATFAARMGFYRFLELQPNLINSHIPYEFYALDSWFESSFVPPQRVRSQTLKFLLRGNRANARIEQHTSWQLAIHLIDECRESDFLLDACQLLEIYILAGAAVNDAYVRDNKYTSALDIVKFKLQNCFIGTPISDKLKRPGSEHIVFDEDQIKQYARKLEAMLHERGAIRALTPPISSSSRSPSASLSPVYQSKSPYAPGFHGTYYDRDLERRFEQLSVSPPNAQPTFPLLSRPVPGQDWLHPYRPTQSFGQQSYFGQRYGYPQLSKPWTPSSYNQPPSPQYISETMYSLPSSYYPWPLEHHQSWPY